MEPHLNDADGTYFPETLDWDDGTETTPAGAFATNPSINLLSGIPPRKPPP